ncbi:MULTISPECIES: hypothetical protein [unclassified Variovorax]|nr:MULTISPECIES: hypothetical protein [unclassified Variovorax]
MTDSRKASFGRTAQVLAAAGLLALSGAALATNQSQQRQAGRDVNQAAKHDARSTKVDCRAANQQSNAACRHDKRDTKQEGRQDKRDIKY